MTTTITQAPSYTPERFKLAHTKLGRKITLEPETVLLAYQINGSQEEFEAYYKGTIVPWLDDMYEEWQEKPGHDPDAQYPIAIYLLDNILLVFTTEDIEQPWEGIDELGEHVNQLNAIRLAWFPPGGTNPPKAAEYSQKAAENPPKIQQNQDHAA